MTYRQDTPTSGFAFTYTFSPFGCQRLIWVSHDLYWRILYGVYLNAARGDTSPQAKRFMGVSMTGVHRCQMNPQHSHSYRSCSLPGSADRPRFVESLPW